MQKVCLVSLQLQLFGEKYSLMCTKEEEDGFRNLIWPLGTVWFDHDKKTEKTQIRLQSTARAGVAKNLLMPRTK